MSRSLLFLLTASSWLSLSLFACGGSAGRFQQNFTEACWEVSDTVRIPLAEAGPLTIQFDLQADYPYRNLYLQLRYPQADGSMKEVLLGETFLDEMGNWLLEPNGGTYSQRFTHDLEGARSGALQLEIVQYMRENALCGVERITLL